MSLDSYSFAHTSVVKRQSGKRRSIICMTFVMTSSKVEDIRLYSIGSNEHP